MRHLLIDSIFFSVAHEYTAAYMFIRPLPFSSAYDSELPNAKGCAQWKIVLQHFGKGGLVIVQPATCSVLSNHNVENVQTPN